ncbi:hypothetical protein ACGFZH_40365 [Streptomyces zaomyceticus]|uniref:hypothetical protein n=1 Tax=Streptomyces zaomyceticus TaxID=68286 RepID=UPI003722D968
MARAMLTPRTEPVGPDGFTLRERSWKREADKHVVALNALLTERGSTLRFTFPAPVAEPFGAPLPDAAYAAALPVAEELADVLRLSTALLQTARTGTRVPLADERVLLLKRAALADRLALAAPADTTSQRTALREAHALMVFDVAHRTGRGPVGPDCAETDAAGGARAYVRQEYDAWHVPLAPGEGI